MIRIDAIWLATEPMDMRAGTDTALARVVAVFGAAKPHCASKVSFIGLARIEATKLNSTPNNFRRWCWACLGSGWVLTA